MMAQKPMPPHTNAGFLHILLHVSRYDRLLSLLPYQPASSICSYESARITQYDPVPRNTTITVFARIARSPVIDQFSMYETSRKASSICSYESARITQYDPVPRNTTITVFARIARSPVIDQFSMYETSRNSLCSCERSERPETCHGPVMPGLTSRRVEYSEP